METLNIDYLRRCIGYSPETGEFTWLEPRGRLRAGDRAGTWNDSGYLCIRIDGRPYRAQRIAWALMNGVWPEGQIDHKNGNTRDNRFGNLRDATRRQNLLNRRGRSPTGLKGVCRGRKGRYRAVIRLDGKQTYLGEFDTPVQAHAAYVDAAIKLHGEFARLS